MADSSFGLKIGLEGEREFKWAITVSTVRCGCLARR